MGNVRLYGATSGYTELAPPAVAPDGVLSLPSGTGTLLTAEGGKVLQVVSATTSTEVSTTSSTYVTTGITATITPSNVASKVLILCSTSMRNALTVATQSGFTLFRGTVAGTDLGAGSYGMAQQYSASSDLRLGQSFTFLDSPATTSAQVYTLGMKHAGGGNTVYASYQGSLSSIILMEVSA
jgi:hypothetical protein